ncbi:MAG: DUF1801 domain-containing protein [Actinomycetota bacterium]
MNENKTVPTGASVEEFLDGVEPEVRRNDARVLLEMFTRLSGRTPEMWGPSIVGFGRRHLRYASGRELDWFDVGFSPRKANLSVHITDGFEGYEDLLARLGKHRTAVSCLYITRLAAVDLSVLEELVAQSIAHVRGELSTG